MSFNIGNIKISNPFILAPMAGVNCAAFRLLCKENYAGLIYTQMYHCEFIINKYEKEGKKALFDFFNINEKERPITIQIVGNCPEKMAKAAVLIQEIADIIDINFGCPDENMKINNSGAYLLNQPGLMKEIVNAVIKKINKPVTAKIRIGINDQNINAVKNAIILEESGIKAIAIHGRTLKQKYSGKANWTVLKQVKEKLKIPVIGNGDVNNSSKAIEMLKKTNVDGVMIGRRAMGDPSIFARCYKKHTKSDIEIKNPVDIFEKFINYHSKYESKKSFAELKTHALWFAKRAALGPKKRELIGFSKNKEELIELFFNNL
ncbi:MAG: tRNA dihydrouridine synthase [Candidatus Woesearchaeota archaeon]